MRDEGWLRLDRCALLAAVGSATPALPVILKGRAGGKDGMKRFRRQSLMRIAKLGRRYIAAMGVGRAGIPTPGPRVGVIERVFARSSAVPVTEYGA